MKNILLLCIVSLAACQAPPKPTSQPPIVSTSGITQNLGEIDKSVIEASTANERAWEKVTSARTLSQRINDKAVIIDRYWNSAK